MAEYKAQCKADLGDTLLRWIAKAEEWAAQAAEEEVAKHHAAASTHFFVAAQAAQNTSEILRSLATTTEQHIASDDQLARAVKYTAKAVSNSKAACDERARLIQASGDDDAASGTQSAELRANIEKRFVKGSKECADAWFNMIIGQQQTKDDIRQGFLYPLLYPSLYPSRSRSLLLYGPPGTGKTLIAKAIANELSVESGGRVRLLLFAPRPAEMLSKFVGETQKQIKDLFRYASEWATQEQQRCGGADQVLSVIFLDEVEAIAGDRASDKTGFISSTLNPLLQEMDGVDSADNVVVIAATNYPWQLDAAFLRRFTTRVLVDLPKKDDIEKYIESKVSRMTAGFRHKAATAALKPDACKLCDLADRDAAQARSDPAAYKQVTGQLNGESVPLVHVTDNLSTYAQRLENALFSLSDVDSLFDKVTKYAGTEARKDDRFLEFNATLPSGVAQQVFVSQTTFAPEVIAKARDDGKMVVMSQSAQKTGEIPVLNVADATYVDRHLHEATVPANWGPLVQRVWVRYINNIEPSEARTLELMLEATVTGEVKDPKLAVNLTADVKPFERWLDGEPFVNKDFEEADTNADDLVPLKDVYVLKLLPDPENVTTEGVRAAAINGGVDVSDVLRHLNYVVSDRYTGRTRTETVWIRLRYTPTSSRGWKGLFGSATSYSALEALGSGTNLLNALIRLQSEPIDVYTQWFANKPDRGVAFKVPSETLITSLMQPTAITTVFQTTPLLASDKQSTREVALRVSNVAAERVGVDGYTKIRLLTQGDWGRVVSWNFSDEAFLDARCKTKPSADAELIALVREYNRDPIKVTGCMLKRPEINEECAAIVKKTRDELKSKPTHFSGEGGSDACE